MTTIIETIQSLTRDKLSSITVLSGDDTGYYQQAKETLLSQIGFDPSSLDYAYFDMSVSDYSQIDLELQSLPFFSTEKIVILDYFLDITTAKKSHLSESELAKLETYITQPNDAVRLLILSPGKLDGKRRLVKLLKRDTLVLEANVLDDKAFTAYFRDLARHSGLQFDKGGFEELLWRANRDFGDMVKHIAFLASYKRDGVITHDDLAEAIPKTLQDNVFDLTRLILAEKVTEAEDLVHDLRLQGEDEIKLIAIMLGQFRLFLQVSILSHQGKSESQLVSSLSDYLGRKVNPYQVRYALRDTKQLRLADMRYALLTLIETDYAIKQGVYDKAYLFDIALLKLVHVKRLS